MPNTPKPISKPEIPLRYRLFLGGNALPVSPQKRKLGKRIISVICVAGCVLTYLEFGFYRSTFIPTWIPLLIWVLPGLLLTPFTKNLYATYFNLIVLFAQAISNMICVGGILVWGFMASNYYGASSNPVVQTLPIKDRGEVGSGTRREPYTTVFYDGMDKMLYFGSGNDLSKYKTTKLTIAKGLWGFDVVKSKSLWTSKTRHFFGFQKSY